MPRKSLRQRIKAEERAVLEEMERLIPYLGPPDRIIDNEPHWYGSKWKNAAKAFDDAQGQPGNSN